MPEMWRRKSDNHTLKSGSRSVYRILLPYIKDDMETVRHNQSIIYDDVGLISDKIEYVKEKIALFNDEIDKLEALSRRDSVIFYNVK